MARTTGALHQCGLGHQRGAGMTVVAQRMRSLLVLVTALATAGSTLATEREAFIHFAAVESWGEPMAVFNNSTLVGGLNYELMRLIAAEAGATAVFITTSRKRADVFGPRLGFDVRCNAMPAWIAEPESYDWSVPAFNIPDLLIWRAGATPVQTLEDLKGRTIGTVLGYRYPPLDELLASGQIHREDAVSADAVLKKLVAGRTDYAIVNQIVLSHQLKKERSASAMIGGQLTIDKTTWQCAVAKQAAQSGRRTLEAIRRLVERRGFDPVLQRYW